MDQMKFGVPEIVPTYAVDQLVELNPTLEQMTALAREKESAHERLKLYHDLILTDAFAPYLPAVVDMADDELEQIIHEAGWTFVKDKFGTLEDWTMWTNRFRRLIALVRNIK